MSFLDTLLRKVLQIGGTALTERRYWNFVSGATAVDNPATGATDIILAGQGGTPLANASTGALPNVVTTDSSGYPVASIRFSGVAPSVSGFASGTAGRVLRVTATGGPLVLVNQATSTAANRIITSTGADVTITNGGNAELVYDATTARWRLTIDGIAGSGGSAAGAVNALQASDGAGAFIDSGWLATSSAISAPGTVAAAGTIRLPADGEIQVKDAADICALQVSGTFLTLGLRIDGTKQAPISILGSGTSTRIQINGTNTIMLDGTSVAMASPIIGYSSSPYGVHGAVISGMGDGDYVAPAGEYSRNLIEVPAAITLTAGRNLDLPLPATEDGSYSIAVANKTTGAFAITVRVVGGAGATVAMLVGTTGELRVRPGGVYRKSAAI